MIRNIRDLLLCVHALAWLAVMGITVWRKSEIDPVLWAALGGGIGVIMGIFRVEEGTKPDTKPDTAPEREKLHG